MKKIIASAAFIATFTAFTAKAQMAMPEPETLDQYSSTSQLQQLNPAVTDVQVNTEVQTTNINASLLNTPAKPETNPNPNAKNLKVEKKTKPIRKENKTGKETLAAIKAKE